MIRASDRLVLAVTVSVLLVSLTLRPLTVDGSYLVYSWLVALLLGAATLGLRRLRVAPLPVLGAQLVVLALAASLLAAGSPGFGETWYEHYLALWQSGIEHMRTSAAPMGRNDGVTLIFVTVIGIIWILTDVLVCGLQRPMWGIAPPATLFLVPAIGLGTDTGLFSFVCVGVGYLGILVAEGLNTTARWTRGLSRDSAESSGAAAPVVWRSAGLIGGSALVLAVIFGIALPTLSLPGLGFGNGPGGGGQLQLGDPTLDLRRNLNQPDDTVVMEYQTNQPGGVYLRMASLPELSASGWHNVPMRLTDGNVLPEAPGLSESGDRRTTRIRVFDFGSEYLPLPYAPQSFTASGNWAFDPNSLVVISSEGRNRNDAIRDLSYSVESVDVAPDPSRLSGSLAGNPADSGITGVVPRDLPKSLDDLTREVIKDADTPMLRAAAIQRFLRSDRFTYSTEPLPGSGYRALENFLLEDRRGYCEQFAGAMAMMARVAGIPSRVAVGFLPGERRGDTWQVSIRNMHAWPELYFAGYGWVRFEPTPAGVTGQPPDWTLRPTTPDDAGPSADPSSDASDAPSSAPSAESAAPSETPQDATDGGGLAWTQTLLGTGIALVVLLVLAAPATVRLRRRAARLSGEGEAAEQVESAWAEIRDTVVDHGGSWPSGSPRAIGAEVGRRLDEEESAEMSQVATLVERSRYARAVDLESGVDLPTMTQEIRRSIAAPQSRFRRAMAVIFPRSLFRRDR